MLSSLCKTYQQEKESYKTRDEPLFLLEFK